MSTPKKVALAYSGGLDTSVIIPWLKENYGCDVVAVCGDVGQGGEELEGLREKALATGAVECHIADMREEFVQDYIWPMVRSGAVYEHKYLLGTSIARPLIAKKQVEVALATGCDGLAHGCTGKGNDQVRFELTYKAFAPQLPVIAPWREWNLTSREAAIAYAEAHRVPLSVSTTKIYSRDRNLWHISHEGGALEDPANAAPDEIWMLTKSPAEAPDTPGRVTIAFEKGNAVAVDGKPLSGAALVEALNTIGGEHAIGRVDLVENRFVGMKSRGCYETPGGTLIVTALRELEALTLDRATSHYKQKLSVDYADLVYNGLWFTPLRESLDAAFAKMSEFTTGEVTLGLYKGNISVLSRKSSYSLYDDAIASFTMGESYDQKDALGFINCTGLPIKVRAGMLARHAK
ncbi:MAG: argininosuccinate synthase [Bryobacterales bacterium]|nr:argininosuccinate synthase [Bryobacterales bacterium]